MDDSAWNNSFALLQTLLDQDNEPQVQQQPIQEKVQEPNPETTQEPDITQPQSQSLLADPLPTEAPSVKKQRTNKGRGRQRNNNIPPATPGPTKMPTETASAKGKGKGRKRTISETEQNPENDCIVTAINRLTEQIGGLSKRMERLESSIDTKIAKHIQKALDTATDKIKADFNAEIKKVREEMKPLKENQANQQEQKHSVDTYLNIVIRNLPESAVENTKAKVKTFLQEALKVDIDLENAERKMARNDIESGVIIASCKSKEDKSKIMKAKSQLRNSRTFRNVYIEHDLPRKDRNTMSNFRTLANVRIFVRGRQKAAIT